MTYKEIAALSDIELVANGYVTIEEYYNHLLEIGVVRENDIENLPMYESKQEQHADYRSIYYYKGYMSEKLGMDRDYFTTLKNGEYEYYGMIEDEVDQYREEHGITEPKTTHARIGTKNNIGYNEIKKVKEALANLCDRYTIYNKEYVNDCRFTQILIKDTNAEIKTEEAILEQMTGHLFKNIDMGDGIKHDVFVDIDSTKVFIDETEQKDIQIIHSSLNTEDRYADRFVSFYDKEADKTIAIVDDKDAYDGAVLVKDGYHDVDYIVEPEIDLWFKDRMFSEQGEKYYIVRLDHDNKLNPAFKEMTGQEYKTAVDEIVQQKRQKELEEQAKIEQENAQLNESLSSNKNVTILCKNWEPSHRTIILDTNDKTMGYLNDNNKKYMFLCEKGQQFKGYQGSCHEALLLDVDLAKRMVHNNQLRLDVPKDMRGYIIGSGGHMIQYTEEKLKERLGCDVKIKLYPKTRDEYKKIVEDRNNRGKHIVNTEKRENKQFNWDDIEKMANEPSGTDNVQHEAQEQGKEER